MRSHISLLPKIPLEGNLNVIKGTNNFLEGHYLVNILVSLKKTMELKKIVVWTEKYKALT